MNRRRHGQPAHVRNGLAPGAFTLIEILLALSVTAILLGIAMAFYRQVADLRGQVLLESERLAAMRLVFDRIAADLRSALPGAAGGGGFEGDASSMTFTRNRLEPGSPAGAVRIAFGPIWAADGTNLTVQGIARLENASIPKPTLATAPMPGEPPPSIPIATPETNNVADSITNAPVEPLTDQIRYLRLRYWSGTQWLDRWTNGTAPPGVEVTLGWDPIEPGVEPDDYAGESFHRVIALPAGIRIATPEPPGAGGAVDTMTSTP